MKKSIILATLACQADTDCRTGYSCQGKDAAKFCDVAGETKEPDAKGSAPSEGK